tara:strand:- start:91 stop:462 length:372 start_codon:yes stop_codon:yes gene_type:complete
METLSLSELQDIDLDIYTLLKKIPNNDLYNSLYIRVDKHLGESFCRLLCNADVMDVTVLLGQLIQDAEVFDLPLDKVAAHESMVECTKLAILNLAISILASKGESDLSDFIGFVSEARSNVEV